MICLYILVLNFCIVDFLVWISNTLCVIVLNKINDWVLYVADDCVLCYVMLLSTTTRDEKRKNSEVLRLRGNGQGRTERKKFVTIEWNMFAERAGPATSHIIVRIVVVAVAVAVAVVLPHSPTTICGCVRVSLYARASVNVYMNFFHHALLLLLWKQNMNFYRQHSRWFVVSMRPTQCNLYLHTIHIHASERPSREYEKESGETNEKQNKIESNRIVLCKRRVRTHSHRRISQWMKRQMEHTNTQQANIYHRIVYYLHSCIAHIEHSTRTQANTNTLTQQRRRRRRRHEQRSIVWMLNESARVVKMLNRLEKHNVSMGFLLNRKCIAFCQFSWATYSRPFIPCVYFSFTFDNFLFNFDDHFIRKISYFVFV